MAAARSIDLSRLPAPDLVGEIDYETARAAWLSEVAARTPGFDAGSLESEPVVIVCEAGALREVLALQSVNDAGLQCMLAYATGANLEHLAANLGIARRDGESDLELRLRAAAAPRGISAAGPEDAYRRHALAASPETEDAAVNSPEPGSVTVTALARQRDPEPDLELGSLPAASGEALRALLRAGPAPGLYLDGGRSGALAAGSLAPGRANGPQIAGLRYAAGAPGAFEAASAAPGLDAWAAGPGAGKSLFAFTSRSGAEFPLAAAAASPSLLAWRLPDGDARATLLGELAEDEPLLLLAADAGALDESLRPRVLAMLAAIAAALSTEDVRPMGDRVTVQSAIESPYRVAATLHVEPGAARAAVLAAAETALRSYASAARSVGRMVPRSGLIAALSTEGVFRVELADPAADLAAIGGGVHALGDVELTGVAA